MLKFRMMTMMACGLLTGPVEAAEHEVNQKGKAFTTSLLKAKVGDVVSFRNDDPFFHNVFSLSDTQSFDLGSYPKGQAKKITLGKEGKMEIECAIHPDMRMVIEVGK